MSKSSSSLIGISISPTHISGVKVSAEDFSLQAYEHQPLPPATMAHDGKRILDTPTLVAAIRGLFAALGQPDVAYPVYLTFYTPFLATRAFSVGDVHALREGLPQLISEEGVLAGDTPIVQYSMLWQHGDHAAIAYAFYGDNELKHFFQVFEEAGYPLQGVDILPLAVLRGMAASGVLDALLRRLGSDAVWGCFGVVGSQTWQTIWQGTNLIYIGTFTIPADMASMQERLMEPMLGMGISQPNLWFAWSEQGVKQPMDLLQLKLGAPVRQAVLGPLYGSYPNQPSAAALGAALKQEVPFPLAWDFLASRRGASAKHHVSHRTAVRAKATVLRFLLIISFFVMLGVLGTSGYYIFQNTQLDAQLRQRDEALSSTISALHQQNGFYQKLMDVINKNAAQVQIDYLRVEMPERVNISGKAAQAQKANAFIDALVSASELKPFQIKAQKRFVMPSDGEKILSQFSFTGKILQDATGSGQAQAKQETKKP